MRVGLLVRTLGTNGGTERFVHGLARWLVAAGHDVVVHAVAVEVPVEGVELRPLRVVARGRVGKLRGLSAAAAGLRRDDQDLLLGFVRAGQPDLYRAGGGSHRAWMARQGRGRMDLLGRSGDRVEAQLDTAVLQSARRIVVNSELARQDLMRFDGIAHDKIALVRNGVDLERFVPRASRAPDAPGTSTAGTITAGPSTAGTSTAGPSTAGPARAIFLGNGWARKNLTAVLHALLALPELQLSVGGLERHPQRWQALARRLGVDSRVEWLGRLTRPEDVLPAFDLFVLPSVYDPCANVCMEALACGLPVITTDTNGAHEVLPEDFMTVSLSSTRLHADLAEAMARALQMPGLGRRCRTVAESLPDYGAFSQLFEEAQGLLPR